MAEERGVEVRETTTSMAHDYVNLVTVRGGDHAVAGTLSGLKGEPRLVMVDDHTVEVPPARHMLVVRNDDRPGMIGFVGHTLADASINIADMALGRAASGEAALMVLAVDQPVPGSVIQALRAQDGIVSAHSVSAV